MTFYDNEQLIRLNRRLNRSTKLHYKNKNSLLLRRDSHFSKLIVLRSHEQMFHSGVERTLSNIRLYYWIIDCIACFLFKQQLLTTQAQYMLGTSTQAVTNYLNIIFCWLHVLLPKPSILNLHPNLVVIR